MRDRWSPGRARRTAEYSPARTLGVALAASVAVVAGALAVMYAEAFATLLALSAAAAAGTVASLLALRAYAPVGRSLRLRIPLTALRVEVTLVE